MSKDRLEINKIGSLVHVIYEDKFPRYKLLIKGVKTNTNYYANQKIRWLYYGKIDSYNMCGSGIDLPIHK